MSEATTQSLTIAIPAYNEAETVEGVAREALKVLAQTGRPHQLLLVDDGSTDGTGEILDRLAATEPAVRVIHHPTNRGFNGAIRTSLCSADTDLVFLAPADGQADLFELPAFLEAIKGCDIAISYRTQRDDPLVRRLGSVVWYAVINALFGLRLKQIASCLLVRTVVLRDIEFETRLDAGNFLPELLYKAKRKGYTFGWVPSVQHARRAGRSKGWNCRHISRTIVEDFSLWWRWRVLKRL